MLPKDTEQLDCCIVYLLEKLSTELQLSLFSSRIKNCFVTDH